MSQRLHLNNERLSLIDSWKKFATQAEVSRMTKLISGSPIQTRSTTIPPLERFCPHQPWEKQRVFLDLPNKEAFYGGAAAGGKSEALLMAALQFVHVPGYAALQAPAAFRHPDMRLGERLAALGTLARVTGLRMVWMLRQALGGRVA